jgi:hypothetical protein
VDGEGAKETADVVPDRLGAQVELVGDLLGRAALLEKTKHLDLAGVRCGCGAVAVSSDRSSNSPNTPTTRSPFISGTELISTGTRVPAGRNQDAGRIGGRRGAEHLAGEQLAGAPAVLGAERDHRPAAQRVVRDDGGHLGRLDVTSCASPGAMMRRASRTVSTVD